eukprot:TRINITY_DN20303_c0_g1_i1.p1 TRINITY_DN20303_c0_g1~~TRINITY_DN20303_c0_g1_i1.p1  ORF type:complete len:149 (+),score=18.79 TRINITY_DN20303_c0_g1_i1:41-448(+)
MYMTQSPDFIDLLFILFFLLMIRRPPRSTLSSSSAASDVYKRQEGINIANNVNDPYPFRASRVETSVIISELVAEKNINVLIDIFSLTGNEISSRTQHAKGKIPIIPIPAKPIIKFIIIKFFYKGKYTKNNHCNS